MFSVYSGVNSVVQTIIIMANIDERLLAASKADKQRQEEMSYRDQLRQEKLGSADKDRQAGGESGSLRQRVQAARQALNLKEKAKQKLEEKVMAPARAATNRALQWAWKALIPSWGLSLIYINIHVFLRFVLGDKLFCKLGQEWLPKQISSVSGAPGEMAGKTIGIVEVMVLLILDLIAFFIVLAILALLVMIATWLGVSWWEKLEMIYDALKVLGWATIKALVFLFQ